MTGDGRARLRRWIARLVLGAGALWVGAAGVSYPLDLPALESWPWSHGWFMFSSDSGWAYRLEVDGTFADGARRAIDPSRWFEARPTATGDRFQEIPRDPEVLRAFAAWTCARVNEGAPPSAKLVQLDLVEWVWPRGRGHRVELEEADRRDVSRSVLLHHYACEAPR